MLLPKVCTHLRTTPMHQLQARLASKWSVFTLSACNTHAGTAHRRHVPDCGRTATSVKDRSFVILLTWSLGYALAHYVSLVMRENFFNYSTMTMTQMAISP